VHVHVLPEGHVQWRTHRLFRDYLRTHADEASAYAATKREVASRVSRADYPDVKAPWVEAAIARAEEWARTGAWEADR
jgi:dephospho-CoA kinase